MTVREGVRRAAVWGVAALCLACGILELIAGQGWALVAWGGYPIAGAVILTARPGNRIGRLLFVPGVVWMLVGAMGILGTAVPAGIESVGGAISPVAWGALPLLVLVYPAGRFETVLGRVVAAAIGTGVGVTVASTLVASEPLQFTGRPNPLAVPALAPVVDFLSSSNTFFIVQLLFAAALVDLVVRWRRADSVRRLQFRWLAYGAVVTLAVLVLSSLFSSVSSPIEFASALAFNAIPVTIMIAVTRHGLYEIDRVISRTVAYTIVTGVLVGVYALVVTSITWLLPKAPSLAVAAATLAAAAVFLPVLRWLRHRIDRRFDRERYDAQKIVDAFGERLRTEIGPAAGVRDLVDAAVRALQPAAIGIWTRGDR